MEIKTVDHHLNLLHLNIQKLKVRYKQHKKSKASHSSKCS